MFASKFLTFLCCIAVVSGLLLPQSSMRKSRTSLNGAVDKDFFHRPGVWDDPTLDSLIDANRAWIERRRKDRPDYFDDAKKGHSPKILWIGCSDARVPAHQIIGEPPGSVFTHRNIANQVMHTDFNCMSVIQYAVDVLRVKHIVVCGHYDCGGVKASMNKQDHSPPLENWLMQIRDTYRLHMKELQSIHDPTSRTRRLVELNVVEQCVNLYKTASIQRRRVETFQQMQTDPYVRGIDFSEPRIHGFVYEPTTGELTKLDYDLKPYVEDLKDVYDLYAVSDYDLWNEKVSSKRIPSPYARSGSPSSSDSSSDRAAPSSSSSSAPATFGRGPGGGGRRLY